MHVLPRSLRVAFAPVAVVVALSGCPGTAPDDWTTLCGDVECGTGRCVIDADRASCACDPGSTQEGLSCIPIDDADPCKPNPCNTLGKTKCLAEGTSAICQCNEGMVELNGVCMIANACAPNPCAAPFQSVCEIQGNEAACLCDPGHAPDETGGCSPDAEWDCNDHPEGGVPDAYEPDPCPPNANPLAALGLAELGHTINPAGDADWFRIDASANRVYEVRVSNSNLMPTYLDAFAADGLTPLASDHRGATDAAVHFKALVGGPLYVRVKALRSSDIGGYTITAFDRGPDDFPDTIARAAELQAGANVQGQLSFERDADVFEIALVPGQSHQLELSWTGQGELRAELFGADGTTRKQEVVGKEPKLLTLAKPSSVVFLRVTADTPWSTGNYTFSATALGPDDHGDAIGEASPLSSTSLSVTTNRSGDVDVLSFHAVEGHIYAVSCVRTAGYSNLSAHVTDANGTVLVQQNYSSSLMLVTRTLVAGQRYVVLWDQYQSTQPSTYGCILDDLGFDDHGDTTTAATVITAGTGPHSGVIEAPGDKDVFSFTAAAGRVYRFNCSLNNASTACNLRLLSASGAQIAAGANLAHETTAAGTLYFEVTRPYSSTGGYSYSLEDLGADDHGDDMSTATPALPGAGSQITQLETLDDVDVFSFTATAQHIYRVTCLGLSCKARILGSTGQVLATSSTYGTNAIALTALPLGTHYVELSINKSYNSTGGSYTWKLEDLGLDDHGDTASTATPIAVGTSGTAQFQYELDLDTFSFPAQSGHVYRVRCTRGTASSCPIVLLDEIGGVLVSLNVSSSNVVELTWEAPTTSTLVARFGTTSFSSGTVAGTYSYLVTDLGLDDHGDTPSAATPVTLPMPANQQGQLEALGDVDVWSFQATAARIYRFTCTQQSLTECRIRARDSAGNAIIASPSANTLAFVALTSGTHFFEVDDGPFDDLTGTYLWLLEDLGPDDHANNVTGATALALGAPTAGELQYGGDVDLFSIPVVSARMYRLTCTSPSGAGACLVTLTTAAGATIKQGTGGVSVKAPSNTTALYAKVSSSYSLPTITYSILAEDLGLDDHGDSSGTATPLSLSTATAGVIEIAGDTDFFSVTLAAGTAHTVTVSGSYYLNVAVFDPLGATVTSGSSPRTFNATSGGTYTFRVSSWSGSDNPLAYSITVQ